MSYLTRLSHQTGLAPAAPQVLPAESSPTGLRQVEEFVAPASSDLSRTVEQPTLLTNAPPRPATPNLNPSPFSGLQLPLQEVVTDTSPEVVTDASRPSVILPEVFPEVVMTRSPPPAPFLEPPAEDRSPPQSMTYLQTLQVARDWVSASPESLPDRASPATVQVMTPEEGAISPAAPLNLGSVSSPWSAAADSTPFPASATEPATTISIGSIQVMVEGPPAPPAPAPARRSESPRPPVRLSRHYLRLR